MYIGDLNEKTVHSISAEAGGIQIVFTDDTVLTAEEVSIDGQRPDDYPDETD